MKTISKTPLQRLPWLITVCILTTIYANGCTLRNKAQHATRQNDKTSNQDSMSGYKLINGLKMYYEIHGKGKPLVLIHGGGSTIQTSFGRVLPVFAKSRQVIAVELQAHGHTADIDRTLTFEQDADDIAFLLKQLDIEKADFVGFSNGGNTAMQIAIRHPDLVRKLVVASAFYKREGLYPQLWESMQRASLESMPALLKQAYLNINPGDTNGLTAMHDKDKQRMLAFKNWRDDDIKSIKAPAMLIIGDQDIVRPEHAVEMYRLLPLGQLVILPGLHGAYIGEVAVATPGSQLPAATASIIEEFLN